MKGKGRKIKKTVTKLKHPLPSYRLSFEKHFEIIKAYVTASKEGNEPVSWTCFEGLVSFSPTYVSANNKFLEDLGLIKEAENQPGKYIPTEPAINFSKTIEWDEEQAKNILRGLILKSWFWEATDQLLKVRNKVSKDDLIKKLGVDAGADRERHYPSLNVIVEYLKYVGLVEEQNGTITYGKFRPSKAPTLKIVAPEKKDMIQIALGDELYAVNIEELKSFLREKGKKLDKDIYRIE